MILIPAKIAERGMCLFLQYLTFVHFYIYCLDGVSISLPFGLLYILFSNGTGKSSKNCLITLPCLLSNVVHITLIYTLYDTHNLYEAVFDQSLT